MRRRVFAVLGLAVLPHLACVSDEALRRVQITDVRAALSCRLVFERLEGSGQHVRDALRHLRTRAARKGANYVVVTDEPKKGWDVTAMKLQPWTMGSVVVVSGDAFWCPAAAMAVSDLAPD